MKKLVLGLLLITGFLAKAQVYNNAWIDYSKTYYKFKVGKTGLYRIPQSILSSAGLGSASAEYFQLWRNGKQVPIYTSVQTGALSSTDYIEFWGEMNDGKPDTELYREVNWHLNDKWSLITDTAAYFLTINTNTAANLRLQPTANNVASTTLPVDAYFMHRAGKYFKDQINPGYAVNVGQYMYSSSYDKGEGWTSANIVSGYTSGGVGNFGKNVFVFNNLNVYKGVSAPAPKFKIAVSGNLINTRRYLAKINSDSVIGNYVDFFNYTQDSVEFSLNTLNSMLDTVTVFNYTNCAATACPTTDRMVVHKYEITYPHNFNFAGQANFEFTLAANASGNYLQITNFAYGSSIPVLYDLTNGKRYVADLSSAPMLKFVLEPSLIERKLVIVNEEASNVNTVSSLQIRNFVDYTASANQGDYLIITNPVLFAGAGGKNPVDEYRLYRNSQAGGGYNTKIYLIDEIIDQFGFGIKKNPAGIRDFLRYARNQYAITPKHVFIVGKGVNYSHQRTYESNADIDKLNLVPTFGWPASDVLFVSNRGSSTPLMSIGRLSVITPSEVDVYLKKVKEGEQIQSIQSPLIKDKAWGKNIVHIVGAGDEALDAVLSQHMNYYGTIISDTLFGANVTTFKKTTSDAVAQLNSSKLHDLFTEGINVITYFGHSSSTTLEFNLDNPSSYNNFQKYPVFIAMGCKAGDFFNFNTTRFQTKETISENYILAPDRGTLGFVASTHFGIVHYLNIWAERAYRHMSFKNYGKTLGEIIMLTGQDVANYAQEDFYARCNTEQTELHGDPALRLNPRAKPDYAIEDSMAKITPGFVSVADASFKLTADFLNIGKSPGVPVVVEIKRQLPDQSIIVVRRDTIPGIRYTSSLSIDIPINPTKEKGLNKIIITIDPDNAIDELFESNNTITKELTIYEDEARPVYPANFAIINKATDTLIASIANPFSASMQYQMELDTTELFNSPMKVTRSVTTTGGIIQFVPGASFIDGTVYYWRIAPVRATGSPNWNTASFIYLANSEPGFNQSHIFQHFKSAGQTIYIDSASRNWEFDGRMNNIFLRNGVYPTTSDQEAYYKGTINDEEGYLGAGCNYNELIFNVIDPVSFKPWKNTPTGLYQSNPATCGGHREYNFFYLLGTTLWRKKAMDFIDSIPDGHLVVLRVNASPNLAGNTYSSVWKSDESFYGSGNSLYHKLFDQGFANLDSFNRPRSFIFIFKKNDPAFIPVIKMSDGIYDGIVADVHIKGLFNSGIISSPLYGPAKAWKQFQWTGQSIDTKEGDAVSINIIGVSNSGTEQTLFSNLSAADQNFDISGINPVDHPYIKIQMVNRDTVNLTPFQLDYWRVTYTPVPEGGINPSQLFYMKDTVEVAEPLEFKVAFKSLNHVNFSDSLKIKTVITDRNNVTHTLPPWKHKALLAGDTLHVRTTISTKQFAGNNTMYVEVNPDFDQPEQHHFNNSFYRNFYVRPDTLNPLLDVTFDNVHILNYDIVSSKPAIEIKLQDEAKWFTLDDPSAISVKVKFPDGSIHPYQFGNDTLQFVAATQAPNSNNIASAVFKPYFEEDGDYELIVAGKDMSQNEAGKLEYRVAFRVFNKPMISNMMNYPNPFTTSTAFVFTITGSEVPQNIRIQILTITGKVVREITKDELGALHIGRNITDFKWDGTDQFGQKLANGVYLYRVITNLNGKALDKFKSEDVQTDKYFNKGYGKMYLMR